MQLNRKGKLLSTNFLLILSSYNDFMNLENISKKIKLTTARRSILEQFVDSKKPLSYEDLKDDLNMDKATFYRNIIKFEEEGIVNSFESNNKKRYYEIAKYKHSHFICNICSKIECIHEKINIILPDYEIDNIIIKGICPDCQK